ncbi:agmatinase [candidate division KSB1 bacterium]|nr:agmatinase [candidate division KSB1 bacterium]
MTSKFKDFMGEPCDYQNSKISVLPVPFERSTSYLKGTAAGPEAIIEASCNVELYDIELNDEPYRHGIHTLPPLSFSEHEPIQKSMNHIEAAVTSIVDDGKWPVILGGEHTISYPIFLALQKKYPDMSVLHLDAHTDLRDQYLEDPFSHACVLRRIREHCQNIVSVGIRSVSQEEADYIKTERPHIHYAYEIQEKGIPIQKIMEELTNDVFITFDLDAIDPSELPSVGTPEPGGLHWYQVVELFKNVFSRKNVVGADIVELLPDKVNIHSDFWAAKMIYKMIGLKFHR